MNTKKQNSNAVITNKSIDISEKSEDMPLNNSRPRFRQNGRCCWGGCSKCVFFSVITFGVLACLTAIIIPVLFIPAANMGVAKTIEDASFVISKLEVIDRKIDFMNASATNYVIMNANMDIRHLHSTAKGSQAQASSLNVAYQGKIFGQINLPSVELQVPDTTVAATTTLYISDPITALTAIACSLMEENPCSWTVLGVMVVKLNLAGTTMYYGSDLNNKTVTFDLEHEPVQEPETPVAENQVTETPGNSTTEALENPAPATR